MATETNPVDSEEQKNSEAEGVKFQQAMMLRYHPQAGRADRLAANLPGDRSMGSTKGTLR